MRHKWKHTLKSPIQIEEILRFMSNNSLPSLVFSWNMAGFFRDHLKSFSRIKINFSQKWIFTEPLRSLCVKQYQTRNLLVFFLEYARFFSKIIWNHFSRIRRQKSSFSIYIMKWQVLAWIHQKINFYSKWISSEPLHNIIFTNKHDK